MCFPRIQENRIRSAINNSKISDSFRKQTDKENESVSETYALFMYDGVKRTS